MKNERVGQLLETAQRTFVCDIRDKMDEIYGLLDSRRDIWSRSDVKRLLKFFHSISGTASTLGFSDLALIGEKWEEKLENVIDRDGQFDKMLLNEVKAVVKDLDQKVYNLIKNLDTPCGESDGSAGDDHEYTSLPNRGKILLVDDDITILKLLENAFTLEGYKVYICEDSLSTMDAITTIKPDLLILDIMMPKVSGYQILKKIRSKPEYSEIYVIFLSAKVNVSDRIKGMKYGADDYITKPFVVEEVITRVEMVMRRSNKYKEKLLKDSLTGAYSRYYFNLRIAEEFERYKRNGTIFSIAFLDMDNYKAVNDRYGHQTGDYVLREVVSYLAKKLRKSDSIYRYGGEEFIILLPDTTAEKAVTVMNRLREGFSTQFISVGKGKFCTTFSVGIKQVSESDENVMKLIDDADKAMYTAKSSGRNRVVVYEEGIKLETLKKTILIVEDENTVLKLLQDRLSNAGYNIVTTCNGKSAIRLAKEIHPDILVLDIILPDINGFEVCKEIKKDPLTQSIKIIILSKIKRSKSIVKGLHIGADDYVTKPFSMEELEARIMRILSSAG